MTKGIDWVKFSIETSNSLTRIEKGCEDFEKACKERHQNLDNRFLDVNNRFDNVNGQINRLEDKISKAVPNWLLTILIAIATGIASSFGTLYFK